MPLKKQIPPYPLRLSAEVREKLENAAVVAGRSLHTEIMLRLEASLEHGGDLDMLTLMQLLASEADKVGLVVNMTTFRKEDAHNIEVRPHFKKPPRKS